MLFVRSLLLTMLSLTLISCATTSAGNTKKSEEQELKVYLFADQDINKDIYDLPSPIRLTLLQLATVIEFDQLNEIITNNDDYLLHLGDSVLDEINVIVKPEETLNFELPLKDSTKYIGVIAAFQDIDNDWKIALKRQAPTRWQRNTNFLYLNVRAGDITQLSKDDAVFKIASDQLQQKGQDINNLEDFDKKKLLRKTASELNQKLPKDLSKGLFLQTDTIKAKSAISNINLGTDTASSTESSTVAPQNLVVKNVASVVEEANLSEIKAEGLQTIERIENPDLSIVRLIQTPDSSTTKPLKTLKGF